VSKKKSLFPVWTPLLTIPLIILIRGYIFRSEPQRIDAPNRTLTQPKSTQQITPSKGLITAKQAVEVYKQNPDWAKAECQGLRRLNRAGQSVNGDFWLSKSIQNYKMTRTQLELMNAWLTGNYCPDVF
tara:strand:+ start:443 stop:826 length:384 start_codon:yes stop_codon:yes gene_type:complete